MDASVIVLIIVIVSFVLLPVWLIKKVRRKGGMMIRCPNCKYEGRGDYKTKGSFAVELVLWLLLIIPGVIYSVWRLSNKRWVCPQCNFDHVVNLGPILI